MRKDHTSRVACLGPTQRVSISAPGPLTWGKTRFKVPRRKEEGKIKTSKYYKLSIILLLFVDR